MDDKTKELVARLNDAVSVLHELDATMFDENLSETGSLYREAAEAIERLSAELADCKNSLKVALEVSNIRAEKLDALKSASAEPVAWICECSEVDEDGVPYRENDIDWNENAIADLPIGTKLYPHPAPAAVQEGWQLVPKEPTEEMLESMNGLSFTATFNPRNSSMRESAWKMLLAAAPKPPVQEDAKDAARGRYMLKHGSWYRSEEQTRIAVLVPHGSDLSCYATRVAAIDAAMEANNAKP